jgi:hypothetical protein
MAEDNFFSRWSRRKVQAKSGAPLPPEPPAPAPMAARAPAAAVAATAQPAASAAPTVSEPVPPAAPAEPAPTLDDALRLTPQDDFSRFVARDVSPEVRNAAVKKLFADPHFNVMDGLDIYIDDYSKPSPLSKVEMAKMVGAQFLKLVDDPNAPKTPANASPQPAPQPVAAPAEAEASAAPTEAADAPTTAEPASAIEASHTDPDTPDTDHDHHPDLQLQPDHAAQRPGPGHGAG